MTRARSAIESSRAIKILARSMFRDLKDQGFEASHIVRFTSEIMEALSERAVCSICAHDTCSCPK